jgi:hypothetical protein
VETVALAGGLAKQRHQQLALGLKGFTRGQLAGPEVQAAVGRRKTGGLLGAVQQGTDHDPVVRPHGTGAIGAAGAVLGEGAAAPNVWAGAMDLAVIASVDVEAVPQAAGVVLEQGVDDADQTIMIPGAILDKGLQGHPVVGLCGGEQGLGDGVLLDVEDQPGEPLDEAAKARGGEQGAQGVQ